MSVRDRIAIVTGGASGIDEGIASVLSEKGATVVIADVDQEAEQTAARRCPSPSSPSKQWTRSDSHSRDYASIAI